MFFVDINGGKKMTARKIEIMILSANEVCIFNTKPCINWEYIQCDNNLHKSFFFCPLFLGWSIISSISLFEMIFEFLKYLHHDSSRIRSMNHYIWFDWKPTVNHEEFPYFWKIACNFFNDLSMELVLLSTQP